MTQEYTGVAGASLPNSITGPEPGEVVTGASVGLVAQGAANQDKFLFDVNTRVEYLDDVRGWNGRVSRGSSRVIVPDGDWTIGVRAGAGIDYSGRRFQLDNTPAALRTITLDETVPVEVEEIEIFVGVMASGRQYTIKSGDGTTICEFWGFDDEDMGVWASFEFEGSRWRLGRNSGGSYSAIFAGTNSVGVVPKAGA